MLRDYAQLIFNILPPDGHTLARIILEIKSLQGAEDTMDVYGPSRTGRFIAFLKLFPTLFEIAGSGSNIRVLPKAPATARPEQPKPYVAPI